MRLAIDASRTTIAQRTGTETYARQLIAALLHLPIKHQVDLYFRDTPAPDLFPALPNTQQKIISLPRLWTHLGFASALWLNRYDVVWTPAHTLPRFFLGKAVVTLHDVGYLYFPEAHPEQERRYLDWTTRFSAHRATKIMADSLATKHDLIQHYQVEETKLDVVYPGVDEALAPITDPDTLAEVRAKYGLPERYLLFVGTLQPRKNIERLVKAFHLWRGNTQPEHHPMVLALAGKQSQLFDPRWVDNIPNVQLLGYVADEDLAALYSGAVGFVFPSLFEGFGFPILEAMRCQTPVVCSNTSSLPELAGDAAILVDPLDMDSIVEGIRLLVENDALRAEIIQKGVIQAQKFTWDQAAQQALQVLESAAR